MRYLLKNIKKILPILFGILLLAVSCSTKQSSIAEENDLQKRSRFFNNYMEEIFPDYDIKDGEYLIILPNGCSSCTKSTCTFLTIRPENIRGKFNAILISQSTLNRLSDSILTIDSNFLIDTTNKLDDMSFDLAGIAIIKIENKQIVEKKSMTVEDFRKGPSEFFKTQQTLN